MNNKLTFITIITIIAIFGLVGSKALFHPGFYSSHDGEHQLVRQYIFDQGLKDGQIPVRFSRQLYNGYGYPLFMFTYRFPFYIGEVFRLAGLSFADSIKAVFLIAYIFSGLAMFWFARRWGNFAGIIASILYMWAPYRFSVMFVRAALGEHMAAVFVPLLFGSIYGGKKIKVNLILGAISVVGLFLSHAMMAQIVLMMFLFWLAGNLFNTRVSHLLSRWRKFARSPSATRYRSGWPQTAAVSLANLPTSIVSQVRNLRIFIMFGLGVGLAAYYLIPAMAYRGLTQKLNPNYFADHFVTLKQLIYSPWGYAFSMKGVENDGMSFQVGAAQWVTIGIATVLIFVFRLKRSLLGVRQGDSLIESITLLAIFFLSIFLMTEKSALIWNRWKNYINIDMPWRFLLMTTFASSALSAAAYNIYKNYNSYIAYLVMVLLVGLAVYGNRNHLRVNEYLDYPDSRLAEYRGTSNSDNEYRPKWDDGGIANTFRPEAQISQGNGEVTVIRSKSNLLELAVKADENIRLDINTFYFPGWKIFVDGGNSMFKYAGEKGIMRVDLTEGYHLVEAKFGEPPAALVGDLISIISFITLIIVIKRP